jgi:hypothetical protein
MPPVPTATLIEHIIGLVKSVPEMQAWFDRIYDDDLQRFVAALAAYGRPQDLSGLVAFLPSRLSVSEYEVAASLLFSSTKASRVEIGLRLHGLPLHAFFELRYGTSVQQRDRVTLTVTAVPLVPAEQDREGDVPCLPKSPPSTV